MAALTGSVAPSKALGECLERAGKSVVSTLGMWLNGYVCSGAEADSYILQSECKVLCSSGGYGGSATGWTNASIPVEIHQKNSVSALDPSPASRPMGRFGH